MDPAVLGSYVLVMVCTFNTAVMLRLADNRLNCISQCLLLIAKLCSSAIFLFEAPSISTCEEYICGEFLISVLLGAAINDSITKFIYNCLAFLALKLRISEMVVRLEAARLLVRRAAATCDESGDCSTKESSMAKLAASQAANFAAYNCIQILGGMGYVTDMPAERYFRDARITEIYGGVSDIQKLVIADLVIKECGSE